MAIANAAEAKKKGPLYNLLYDLFTLCIVMFYKYLTAVASSLEFIKTSFYYVFKRLKMLTCGCIKYFVQLLKSEFFCGQK